jgi:DNA-binding Xre family transcriptional regulator
MKTIIKKADSSFEKTVNDICQAVRNGVTSVVGKALQARGWSKQNLADATGIAQPTVSVLLREGGNDRSWTLNHLVRVAVALGVSLSDLVSAAESGEQFSELMIDLTGTEPASKERLTRIIQTLAAKGTSPEVLDLYFTADMMTISVPEYVKEYLNGDVDDRSVYETLTRVNENLGPEENLWGKLAKLMAKPKSE